MVKIKLFENFMVKSELSVSEIKTCLIELFDNQFLISINPLKFSGDSGRSRFSISIGKDPFFNINSIADTLIVFYDYLIDRFGSQLHFSISYYDEDNEDNNYWTTLSGDELRNEISECSCETGQVVIKLVIEL